MANNNALLGSVLLEEYKSLRAEIGARSTAQAGILSLNMTAIAAVAALFSYTKDGRVFFLIPVISTILGAMYTDHAINIGKLGRFIRWQVKPRLAEAAGVDRLLDYEVYVHHYVQREWSRRHLLPLAIVSMFVWLPVLALVVPFLLPADSAFGVVSDRLNLATAAPGAVLLVWFMVLYFPVHYGGRTEMSERPVGIVAVGSSDYRMSADETSPASSLRSLQPERKGPEDPEGRSCS
jgi:hypothetical protein